MLRTLAYAQAALGTTFLRLRDQEEGQTMAEYAVILAVVVIGVVVAITALAGGIGNALDKVKAILP
jgi:Flp pilus assembly pilin Flp